MLCACLPRRGEALPRPHPRCRTKPETPKPCLDHRRGEALPRPHLQCRTKPETPKPCLDHRRGEALPRPHLQCRTKPETPKPCLDHEDSSRYPRRGEALPRPHLQCRTKPESPKPCLDHRRGEALPRPHLQCRTKPETPKPCLDHEDSSRYPRRGEALPRPHLQCHTKPESPKPCLDHEDSSQYRRRGEALPRPHPATPRVARRSEAMHRDLFVPAVNERVGMNDRGRPSGSPLRWDTWSFWPDRAGARHCLALIAICLSRPERVGMNDRGRPSGSPLRTHGAFGRTPRHCLALIRRRPASPTIPRLPRDLFVPAVNERVGMNDRGRPSGSPLRWDTWSFWPDRVGATHCLALIRRRPASPTIPRLPRDLFVPAVNERVGMNDRGRPSGSPLRWDTWSFWPDRGGRGTASPSSGDAPRRPPLRGHASRFVCPGHERARWHE